MLWEAVVEEVVEVSVLVEAESEEEARVKAARGLGLDSQNKYWVGREVVEIKKVDE